MQNTKGERDDVRWGPEYKVKQLGLFIKLPTVHACAWPCLCMVAIPISS